MISKIFSYFDYSIVILTKFKNTNYAWSKNHRLQIFVLSTQQYFLIEKYKEWIKMGLWSCWNHIDTASKTSFLKHNLLVLENDNN